MNIAIIGGGISGLATYLQLQKHFSTDKDNAPIITIFESHDLKKASYNPEKAGLPTIGGGYGLAANGMASLRRLDPGIHDHVLRNSFPTPRFQMKTRQGWTLGAMNAVQENESGGPETCCMVLREVVLEALYGRVPADVVKIRRVAEVVDEEDAAVVRFAGGGEEMRFDLVVGADGIWSRVRKAISDEEDKTGPEYRGLATLGGFIETKHLEPAVQSGRLPYPQSQTIMIFGHNGFLAYSPCNAAPEVEITADHIRGTTMVPRGDMGFWWARSAHADPKMEPDVEVSKKALAEKLQSWRDPNVAQILEHSLKTAMIPTYVLPKQRTWAARRMVLVGDAAHALPTSSGQGVSQSLEDAEALGMLLAHHFSAKQADTPDSSRTSRLLQKTFEQYMNVRKAHVERVLDAGNRGGDSSRDLNVVAEYTMYAFFWVMLRFFGGLFSKEVQTYDVVEEVKKVTK